MPREATPDPNVFMTAAERSLTAASPVLEPVFDVLQRGQYASANVAQELADARRQIDVGSAVEAVVPGPLVALGTGLASFLKAAPHLPQAVVQGFSGEQKGDYIDIVRQLHPDWPEWLQTGTGFLFNIALDPSTYVGLGAPVRGSRVALSFAGRSLLPDAANKVVVNTVGDAAKKVAETKAGQWIGLNIGRKFDASAGFPSTELYDAYRDMRDEIHYLINVADQNRIPRAQAVQTIEQKLGMPREVLLDLIERPVVWTEEARIQQALPMTQTVSRTVAPQEEVLGRLQRQVETARLEGGNLPPGYTRDFGKIRTPEDATRAKEQLLDLYMDAIADRFSGAWSKRNDPWFEPFAVYRPRAVTAIRNKDTASPVYRALREEAAKQLDAGNAIPEFPKEWADVYETLRLLEMPELQRRTVRTETVTARQPSLEGARTITEEVPVGADTPLFREHAVAEGETLADLARRYNAPEARLKELNPGKLAAGGTARVPYVQAADRLQGQPELVRMTVDDFHRWAGGGGREGGRVALEQAAGVDITPLQDSIEYMSHFLTDEAKKALGKEWNTKWRRLFTGEVQHGSTIERTTRNLTIADINRLGEEGRWIAGFSGKVLKDDPIQVDRLRDVLHARAIATSHFLDEIKADARWAVQVDQAPEGFVELGAAAKKRLGKAVEGWKFSPETAEMLTKVVENTFDPQSIDPLLGAYEQTLRLWRTWTLGTSPRWIANNILGNEWNSAVFAGAVNPANKIDAGRIMFRGRNGATRYQIQQGDTLSQIARDFGVSTDELAKANSVADPNRIIAGSTLVIPQGRTIAGRTENEILDLAERHGVLNQGLYGEMFQEAMQGAAGALEAVPRQTVFRANTAVENHARLALFLDGLRKGMDPEESARRVKQYLFDYSELSDFEKNTMRNIAPFYTWWRKEMPLLLEHAATTPGRYGVVPKTVSALEADTETLQSKRTLPEYMQEGLYAQTGTRGAAGEISEFKSLYGLPPSELAEMTTDPLGYFRSANPLINALLSASGYSAFRNEPIREGEQRVLGVPMSNAASDALFSLVPALRHLNNIVNPRQDLRQELSGTGKGFPERLTEFLTGNPTVLRNRYEDMKRALREMRVHRGRLNYEMKNAMFVDPGMAQRRLLELDAVIDAEAELIAIIAILESQIQAQGR